MDIYLKFCSFECELDVFKRSVRDIELISEAL